MTPDELARLKLLAEKATPGPWFVVGARAKIKYEQCHMISRYDEADKKDENIAVVWYDEKTGLGLSDAAFIASSREAIPSLIAEVERLREALKELTDAIESGLCNSGTPAADPPERLDMAMTVARAALEPKP